MAKFSKIEIHFEAGGRKRVATIAGPKSVEDPDLVVKAIHLTRAAPTSQGQPKGVTLDDGPEVAITDGPGVCYEFNGGTVCW